MLFGMLAPMSRPPALSGVDQEQILGRFEEAWRSGPAPAIDQFVVPGNRQLLEELVKIDLNYRWQRRVNCLRLEDYVARHPLLGPVEQLSLSLIGTEYWARRRYGDGPAQQEYVARFGRHGPALLTELRRVDAELAAEQQPAADRSPPAPVGASSSPPPAALGTVLRGLPLLTAGQLEEVLSQLEPRFPEPRALARELLSRGWLTPYQVNLLLQGRAQELVLGPYVLLERLGSGGGGQVFKARHSLMQRIAAVKVIRKELLANAEVVSRFQREILSISQLTHPNIVQAYDAGAIGAGFYLAMEYVEGIDLSRLVKRDGPLTVETACGYARQAALGLQHISERGLVHRDIKPSNLMLITGVSSLGNAAQIKILDLGLARLERPAGELAALTDSGAVMMGTLDYMAPEQALNAHQVDARADIYSLGCTLFYLLTGKAPYSGGTLAQTLVGHQQEPVPDISRSHRELPPGLNSILKRMMAKQPAERFATAAEVAQALGQIAAPPAARALVPVSAAAAYLPVPVGPARGEMIVIDVRPRPPVWKRVLPALREGRRGLHWLQQRPRRALAALAGLIVLLLVGWLVLRPSGPGQAFLSDLREDPVQLDAGAEFRKDGTYRQFGGKIQLITSNGTPAPHALFVRPPRDRSTIVAYPLDGRFRWFRATVGMADGSSSVDSLRFKVLGDGKLLWESKLITTSRARDECQVDIRAVKVLQLSTYWSTPNHESYPIWIDAQVGR
jgi:serine/threonine-protein kinase